MKGRSSMTQAMERPLFLKAGIPFALSVAGLICVRFISRRYAVATVCPIETEVSSVENDYNSREQELVDDTREEGGDDKIICPSLLSLQGTSDINEEKVGEGEEATMSLKGRIEELEKRECEMARQILEHQFMKEQEVALIELRNMLVLESVRMEFLDKEVSSMVEEKRRFERLVLGCLKVVKQYGFLKLENGMLRRKVRKFLRKANQQSLVMREKNSKIEAARGEILSCREELEERANVIKRMREEMRELQTVVHNLQEEKNELQVKLNSSEFEAGTMRIADHKYNMLVDELEKLRKERAAEVTEITRLRWTNACLRHELMRSQKQLQHQIDNMRNHLELENEVEGSPSDGQIEQDLGNEVIGNMQYVPKRKKFLRKIKRWVEGGSGCKPKLELEERVEGGRKSVGVFVYADAGEEHVSPARRSCSSA